MTPPPTDLRGGASLSSAAFMGRAGCFPCGAMSILMVVLTLTVPHWGGPMF